MATVGVKGLTLKRCYIIRVADGFGSSRRCRAVRVFMASVFVEFVCCRVHSCNKVFVIKNSVLIMHHLIISVLGCLCTSAESVLYFSLAD